MIDILINESGRKSPEEAASYNILALAHLGDAVLELFARNYALQKLNSNNGMQHLKTVELVNASAQSEAAMKLQPFMNEDEFAVYKRGRNAKVKAVPKHAEQADYHRSTGLEALFGYLFLTGESGRMTEFFNIGFIEG